MINEEYSDVKQMTRSAVEKMVRNRIYAGDYYSKTKSEEVGHEIYSMM